MEDDPVPVPPDAYEKTEWAFTRLMYPSGVHASVFGSDRQLAHRLSQGRPPVRAGRAPPDPHPHSFVEQVVDLDSDEVFNWPWLYAVEVGHWNLTDAQCAKLREYLLRGGFFMCDDFHGTGEWNIFMASMSRVFPDRPIVEIDNKDPIFHVLYDLDERYQVPGMSVSGTPDASTKRMARRPTGAAIYDDNGRVMVAICFNQDNGDAWEWADHPAVSGEVRFAGLSHGHQLHHLCDDALGSLKADQPCSNFCSNIRLGFPQRAIRAAGAVAGLAAGVGVIAAGGLLLLARAAQSRAADGRAAAGDLAAGNGAGRAGAVPAVASGDQHRDAAAAAERRGGAGGRFAQHGDPGGRQHARWRRPTALLERRAAATIWARSFRCGCTASARTPSASRRPDQLTGAAPATHIGDSLKQVLADSSTLPLGAVVLLSDGADNSGGIDLDTISQIRRQRIPIHTIGFGREKLDEDIEITDVDAAARARWPIRA